MCTSISLFIPYLRACTLIIPPFIGARWEAQHDRASFFDVFDEIASDIYIHTVDISETEYFTMSDNHRKPDRRRRSIVVNQLSFIIDEMGAITGRFHEMPYRKRRPEERPPRRGLSKIIGLVPVAEKNRESLDGPGDLRTPTRDLIPFNCSLTTLLLITAAINY